MRHSQYTQIGRRLAERHVAIQHSATECRFVRVLISTDPIQKQLDLTEFYSALRTRLKMRAGKAAVILENYQADYDDNQGDFYAKYHHAAFIVLKQVREGDFDGRDTAIDECEEIGEDLMGAWIEELTEMGLRITPADVLQEAVGPIGDGLVGCRFNFMFRTSATLALSYNEDKFLD